jgi:hypothetical protein
MYTYNIYCFGHQLALDKNLNNSLYSEDVVFSKKINGKKFVIEYPYHGNQIFGEDTVSCIFGIEITDDDNNPYFIEEVKSSKEEDYLDDYRIFLNNFFKQCEEDFVSMKESEYVEEYKSLINNLLIFTQNNKPKFYTVEVSS